MYLDKKYNLLMPPFLVMGLLLLVYLPSVFRPYIIIVVPLIFWVIYYKWKTRDKNKNNR